MMVEPNKLPSGDELTGGGADDDVIRHTAADDLGVIPAGNADEAVAFITRVIDYAKSRITAKAAPLTAPAVFIFVKYPSRTARKHGMNRIRAFYVNPIWAVEGALHVANAALGEVFELTQACTDPRSAFDKVVSLGLHECPTVILLPDPNAIILCPYGVESEDACTHIPLRSEPVTVQAVDLFLSRFHESWLETPHHHTKIWHDKDTFVPLDRTEKRIQDLLFPYARASFGDTHNVREEDDTKSGRSDITITPKAPTMAGGSCVLELKVLRAKRYHEQPTKAKNCPPAVNAQAVSGGITQALNYRRDLAVNLAFLCCYDMRRKHNDDAIIRRFDKDAKVADVRLRRYFLFNSAEAYRDAQPGAVPKPSDTTKKAAHRKGRNMSRAVPDARAQQRANSLRKPANRDTSVEKGTLPASTLRGAPAARRTRRSSPGEKGPNTP